MRQERVGWTVAGETLELKTLETQQSPLQIKSIPIERLVDKCIVPKQKNRRTRDNIHRINKLKIIIGIDKDVDPITVLEDSKGEIVTILDGNHRVRLYEDMGRKEVEGKIIEVDRLTEDQNRILVPAGGRK